MSTAVQILNSTNMTVQFDDSNKRTLIDKFLYNRNIEEPFYSLLIIFYSFLIVLGSTGNILVVLAVLRNKQMQTARYIWWLITL